MFHRRIRPPHERWLDTSSAALSAVACIAVLSAPFIADLPRAGQLMVGAASPSRLVADAVAAKSAQAKSAEAKSAEAKSAEAKSAARKPNPVTTVKAPSAPPPATTASKPPPGLAQPPAIADPSVPSPAAPLPPESWSTAEIEAGETECAALLGPLDAEVEKVTAFREGICGAPAPIMLRRLGGPQKVEIQPAALTNCRVAAGLSDWLEETLQPAAREAFGAPVTRIIGASSYACRNRYGKADERISEHAFANAIDISGFVLADGRKIDVKTFWGTTTREARAAAEAAKAAKAQPTPAIAGKDQKVTKAALEGRKAWQSAELRLGGPASKEPLPVMPSGKGEPPKPGVQTAESTFLHRLHAGACQIFGTVLGPEANDAHKDHFHLDMKPGRKKAFCE